MNGLQRMFDWFAGGATPYHNLIHCMSHDTPWIVITVVLDLAVALGYVVIALHWWRNQRALANPEARRALGNMRDIFIFCGICGYLFIPIKLFWPAWRLYDMFMIVLVYLTWRYAWGARDLKVVYSAIQRGDDLEHELAAERKQSERRSFFLNAISHDLKNPLYAISLQAEVAEGQDDPEMLRRSLTNIRSSCREASGLLEQFLELGRADRLDADALGDHAEIDARALLEDLAHPARDRAAGKGVRIDVAVDGDVRVLSHERQLRQVLGNIIDNAVKFTEAGVITLSAEAVNGEVRFCVSDTGPGIEPAHAGSIFEEFYQVHNNERERSKGHGLGLAIADRLTQCLGGSIRVDSEPGSGSRFTVALRADTAFRGIRIDPPT